MGKYDLKIGIIDDEQAKSIDIKTKLKISGEQFLDNSTYKLSPIVLEISQDMEAMLEMFKSLKIDALIIDYVLTRKSVPFKGVDIAKAVISNFGDFPIFILTSFSQDLFNTEDVSVYNVYNYGYFNDKSNPNYRNDFFIKIVKEILNYRKEVVILEENLNRLIDKKDKTATDIDLIINLSNKLEKHITRTNRILPAKLHKDFTSNKLVDILEKIEHKLEQINENKY